jgi:hypothetical protein
MDVKRPARSSDGVITEDPAKQFTIEPGGQAIETMAGLRHGPYASLDAALTEIETHTRGVRRTEEGRE